MIRPLRPLPRCVSAVLAAALLAAPGAAQDARPDQVFIVDRRSGGLTAASGTVTKNTLAEVVVEGRGGSEQTFEGAIVKRIAFGAVPDSYREGLLLEHRGDLANAAAMFKLAAADDEARDVVRASARLLAAEALLLAGAVDPSSFADADTAATRFIEEFGDNRELPRARYVQAQARLGAGDAASAAELFRALYREAAGVEPTTGYDPLVCSEAGLRAADAYLWAGDTLAAREIYTALTAKVPGVIAALDEDSSDRERWISVQSEARLGEGFVLLAAGSVGQARTFFDGQVVEESSPAALRFGVLLGKGLVGIAEGDYRQASFDLATVSGIDHTDRDRAARALIGLAQAALNLPDSGSRQQAQTWLQSVLDHYPDTIWVRRAHELKETL